MMVSSAIYARLDGAQVAAFSPTVVQGVLRGQLGFSSVVVSDDLGAAAAVRDVPAGQRAVRFLRAGGDLVLTVTPSVAAEMASAVRVLAASGPGAARGVMAAALRVLRLKQQQGLLRC